MGSWKMIETLLPRTCFITPSACADELLPVELDGAGDDLARGGEDLHDGIRGHGFAGAGFADDAEHLALVK